MTSTCLLLYRLAELMLQHEQHILPVDLLFDDEQIGDFVKSIQIDSPYQQMLSVGMLTESFKEEKLFVSFTIEGYFHYVLGEVIYMLSEGKEPEFLNRIIEENKLIGAREGVEQCLLRDVQNQDVKRLIWLIDFGGKSLEICSIPLANAFLQFSRKDGSSETTKIEEIVSELLANPSENDLIALEKTINHVENLQDFKSSLLIFSVLSKKLKPNSLKAAILLAKSIKSLDKKDKLASLNVLEDVCYRFPTNEDFQSLNTLLAAEFKAIGDFKKALKFYELSLELSKKLNGETHKTTAQAFSNLGNIYSVLGDYDQALTYYTLSLDIQISLFGPTNENSAPGYSNVGAIWSKKGDLVKALEYYNKALEIKLQCKGKFHLETALCYSNVGAMHSKKDSFELAGVYYNRSLDIRLKILGENHLDTAVSLTNMGSLYSKLGDLDKAVEYYQTSLKTRLLNLDENHPDIALNLTNLGAIYSKKKDFVNALKFYKQSMDIRLEALGPNHDKTALSMINYGSVLTKLNKKQEAKIYFEKSKDIYTRVFGAENEKTLKLLKKIENLTDR